METDTIRMLKDYVREVDRWRTKAQIEMKKAGAQDTERYNTKKGESQLADKSLAYLHTNIPELADVFKELKEQQRNQPLM